MSFERVRFRATDGVWLSGWKITAALGRPWVIFCHGLGANRSDLLELAANLFTRRFNLLLFDFRGHGESGGRGTTFGCHEQRDLEGALAYLGTQPEVGDRPYGAVGVSMGASVALAVAARDERLHALALAEPKTPRELIQQSLGQAPWAPLTRSLAALASAAYRSWLAEPYEAPTPPERLLVSPRGRLGEGAVELFEEALI